MSKQLYVDPNHTITRTPLHLYNYCLDRLDKVERVKAVQGITEIVTREYKGIISNLGEALMFGEAEAAAVLAYLYYHGYGYKQNINKVKLYIAIGNNLGSEVCNKYMKGQDDETLDIGDFLKTKPVYSTALLNTATNYANACKVNAKNHPSNELITSEIIVEAQNIFEAADPSHILDDPLNIEHYGKTNLAGDSAKHHHCDIL
ncbi:hypothetical protein [Rickettsia endosymbiont of Ceutorhynchus obstrictus]|uniref:hypothetical protein n=1 Tax=Rickettsia endosymbiont of Ceutorhynchus obstrictus TaxID=3066249 RepID=UPI003132F066